MTTYSNVAQSTTHTLVGATVDTVVFAHPGILTVVNHDSTESISVLVGDFGTPTVDGDNTVPVLPRSATQEIGVSDTVKLISSGAPKYTVISV